MTTYTGQGHEIFKVFFFIREEPIKKNFFLVFVLNFPLEKQLRLIHSKLKTKNAVNLERYTSHSKCK